MGTMAKIDDSVKKKVPELRFAGFADDWEERKLGEFSDVRDGTHASPKYVSQGHPMVTSKNLTHSGLDMADVSFLTDEDFNEINKRSKVSIGDILFGMIGTIGNPVIVDRDDFAIKNVALIKEKTSNPITNKWLLQYLKSPSFNRFIQKENAGGTQKFIALGLIRDMKLRVPEFDEQQKIGSFFKQLDDTISLHQRKLDLLKEQKKGYLQKMFPKNGAKVPELRFAGFADDWEERNLGEWSDVRDGTHASPKYIKQGHPMVTSKNLTDSGLDMSDVSYLTDEDFNEINQRSKVDIGDILFGMIGTIGKPVIVDRDDFAIKNVALIKEKTSPEIINTWLIQYLKSPSFERFIQKENAGGTQKFIALGLIRDMKLMTPSVQEQARIGELLNHLDNLIVANQRKLDLLKEQKKGFLQKMFV